MCTDTCQCQRNDERPVSVSPSTNRPRQRGSNAPGALSPSMTTRNPTSIVLVPLHWPPRAVRHCQRTDNPSAPRVRLASPRSRLPRPRRLSDRREQTDNRRALTRIRRRDRLSRPPAERLAHRRDGDDHRGPNEPDDDRVEEHGLLVRLSLLSVSATFMWVSVSACAV